MPAQALDDSIQNCLIPIPPEGISLFVKYVPPSLNRMYAMNPWGRCRERRLAQRSFSLALQSAAFDSSTRRTSQQSISPEIAFKLLEQFHRTMRQRLNSASAKRRSKPRRRKGR